MNFDLDKPFTFDRVIRILITVGIFVLLFTLIKALQGVLLPFFVALLLAYLLNPLVEFLQFKARLKKRVYAVLVSLILVVGVCIGLYFILVPLIAKEVSTMSKLVRDYVEHQHLNADFLPADLNAFIRDLAGQEDLKALFSMENVRAGLKEVLHGAQSVFSGSAKFVSGILSIVTIILYLIFIMLDYDKISGGWQNLIPGKFRSTFVGLFNDLKGSMNKYFRAQALVALIVGILFAIGFSFIGLPLAVILGLFIGLLNMVPYLQMVGFVPSGFCALLLSLETGSSFWYIMLFVVIVFAVVQLIQEVILTPKIMGDVTGMNPALILLSLSVWGSLLGILGMIIALPVTTLLISYYQRFLTAREKALVKKEPEKPD